MFKYLTQLKTLSPDDVRHLINAYRLKMSHMPLYPWYDAVCTDSATRLFNALFVYRSADPSSGRMVITDTGVDFLLTLMERALNRPGVDVFHFDDDETSYLDRLEVSRKIGLSSAKYAEEKQTKRAAAQRADALARKNSGS